MLIHSNVYTLINCRRLVLLLSLYIACVSNLYASDIDALTDKLSLLNTFSGEFEQTLIDDEGQVLQTSSGVFSLKRPGYFYWETLQPFPQLLISDLNTIWLYDPDLEQVSVRPYDDKVTQTPALLLSGDVSKVNDAYHVERASVVTDNASNTANMDEINDGFILFPKQSDTLFTRLYVEFTNDQLTAMQLHDSLGQKTLFTFSQGVYNQVIPDERFQFFPPEGVDVIQGQ